MPEQPPDHISSEQADALNTAYGASLLGRIQHAVLDNGGARGIIVVVAALVLIIPSIQFVVKIQNTEWSEYRQREDHDSALGRWLPDARAVVDGGNPYGVRHWFPAPPLVLLSIVPLSYLPITAAGIVWAALKVICVVLGCWMLISSMRRGSAAVPLGVMLMAAFYCIRPMMGDITHGNINIFVFFEIALAWYLYVTHRDWLAGAVVGLAIATKVTPGLLLLYFIYKRQWDVVCGAALGLLLAVVVIPAAFVGWMQNVEFLADWYRMMIVPYVHHGFVTIELKNQSLQGALTRVLGYFGVIELENITMDQARIFGSLVQEMARPATAAARVALRSGGVLIVILLAWLCRSPTKDRRDPRLLLELALVMVAMLLLSERTWKHHLTTLPIVYLAVWYVLACYPWSPTFRLFYVVGLMLQLLCLVVLRGDKMLFVGVIPIGLLLCFFQTGVLLLLLKRVTEHRAAA